MAQLTQSSHLQAANSSPNDVSLHLDHRTELVVYLAKRIAVGSRSSKSVAREQAAQALKKFIQRMLDVINPDEGPMHHIASSPVEQRKMRLAAAKALIVARAVYDKELCDRAFLMMGLVMQDKMREVRALPGHTLTATITCSNCQC